MQLSSDSLFKFLKLFTYAYFQRDAQYFTLVLSLSAL